MAVLLIDFNRDDLLWFSGSGGLLAFRIEDVDEPRMAFNAKVIKNDRIDELGVAFLHPDSKLEFRTGYVDWTE